MKKKNNPFTLSYTKSDFNLIGRSDEIQEIASLIKRGIPCFIFGPRWTGKSFLLFYFSREIALKELGLWRTVSCDVKGPFRKTIYIDCRDIQTPEAFIKKIIKRLNERYTGQEDIESLFEYLDRKLECDTYLWDERPPPGDILLLIDEIDLIAKKEFTHLFNWLSKEISRRMTIITTSKVTIKRLLNKLKSDDELECRTSTFWGIFNQLKFGLMKDAEIADLISKSNDDVFAEAVYSKVLQETGAYPIFVQKLVCKCYHEWNKKKLNENKFTEEEWKNITDWFDRELYSHFESVFITLKPKKTKPTQKLFNEAIKTKCVCVVDIPFADICPRIIGEAFKRFLVKKANSPQQEESINIKKKPYTVTLVLVLCIQ